MTEDQLPPVSSETPLLEKLKTGINKKVIFTVVGLLIATGAAVGVSNIQAASKFNSFVSKIDVLLEKDDLDEAQSVLNASKESYGEKADYKRLVARVSELVKSKEDFSTAEEYFSESKFVDAISYYKRVKEIDEARKGKSISKIEESTKLAVASAIANAKELIAKRNYVDALSTLSEVNSLAGDSAEFKSLKSEISPLAAEQVRKEEAARNAKYLSALRSMRTSTDKFNGITFYKDRSTPYYANYSTFHLYIGKASGSDPYLRFVVRYSADDWLFVKSAEINIDGSRYDLDVSSSEWETDNGSGDIWEWIDIVPSDYHLDLIEKIINSRSAVIRFYGSQYRNDRTISSSQKNGLRNILNAYEGLKRGLG